MKGKSNRLSLILIDATANVVDVSRNGTSDDHYLPFDKTYPVPDGSELVVTIVAVDSFGFTHTYEMGRYVPDGNALVASMNADGQILYAPGEYPNAKEM